VPVTLPTGLWVASEWRAGAVMDVGRELPLAVRSPFCLGDGHLSGSRMAAPYVATRDGPQPGTEWSIP
jgi:hypothetical protein